MRTELLEVFPELIELVFFAVGSVLLSAVGVYVERFALQTAVDGQLALGAVFGVIGAVAFYFAYLLVTDQFRPRLAEFGTLLATDD